MTPAAVAALTNDEAIAGLSWMLRPELGWTHTRGTDSPPVPAEGHWALSYGVLVVTVVLHHCGQLDLIMSVSGSPVRTISPNADPHTDTCNPTRRLTNRDLRDTAGILIQAGLPVRHGPTIPTNPRGTSR